MKTWIANHAVWYTPEQLKREEKPKRPLPKKPRPPYEPLRVAFSAEVDLFREARERIQTQRKRKARKSK